MLLNQLFIIFLQCIVTSIVLLALFQLRSKLGLALLYITIGMLKYMHFFLSKTFLFQIYPGFNISLGSAVLFTAVLFTILLLYVKEGGEEARKIIYALIFANFAFAALHTIFTWNMDNIGIINKFDLPKNFFSVNWRIFIGGMLFLFIDSFLIIWLYESFSRKISFLFLRIFFTMILVLSLHSIVFSTVSFAGSPKFQSVLLSGLLSKLFTASIYSSVFWFYLRYFEEDTDTNKRVSFFDVFNLLSYRDKYENVLLEKQKQEFENKKLSEIIIQSPFYVIITDIEGRIEYVNPAFTKITGWKFEEIKGKNPRFLQSGETMLETYKDLWNTILAGKTWHGEMKNISKTGEIFWEFSTISPIFNLQKEIVNFVSLKEDITERKKNEKELQKYREHLEELVQDRTEELDTALEEQKTLNEELFNKNEELERYNRLFVDREFRIKELRDKVKELEEKLQNWK